MSCKNPSGSVLIMDDEDLVSTIAIQMFEFLGYDAVCARSGEEAVERYRERFLAGKPFTAVIMDLSIPAGMGGEEAVKHVLQIDPQARVVVSSGYSLDPVMVDYQEHGFAAAIAKPFNLPDLARLMEEITQ